MKILEQLKESGYATETTLESRLFNALKDVKFEETTSKALVALVDFLKDYEQKISLDDVNEEISICGIYPATEQVKKIDWDRIKKFILEISVS